MVNKGGLKEVNQQMLLVSDNIDEHLDKMKNYGAPIVVKWISRETVLRKITNRKKRVYEIAISVQNQSSVLSVKFSSKLNVKYF